MRVIGGNRRGTRLQSLPGRATRPTADRVKEALFNMLAVDVPDARVLDLFAGSGALGIEALSRGASAACFVEQSVKAAVVLRANVARTHFQDEARIVVADVFAALPRLAQEGHEFDVVFIDPPYADAVGPRCIRSVATLNLLSADGVIVIEHDLEEDMPERIENFTKTRRARYGRTGLSFYRPNEADATHGGDE